MIIDCIGCLHGAQPKLQGGDLLIITGDLTTSDKPFQFIQFLIWLDKQKYSKKVFIGGNHDNILVETSPIPESLPENTEYLCDSGTEFEGLKIWGSPWTAQFPGINPKCCAFTENFGCDTDDWLNEHWEKIPEDTDILITHNPPFDIFDRVRDGKKVGSKSLLIKSMHIKPKLHVFSHIHEEGGKQILMKHIGPNTWYVNCSIMNEDYKAVHKPIRITLP